MKIRFVLLLLGIAVISTTTSLLHRCPPRTGNFSDFYNVCTCVKTSEVLVTCQGLATNAELLTNVQRLRNHAIDVLTLKKCGPLALTSSPFRGLCVNRIILEEVNFPTLALFSSFKGLEFALEELHFVTCNVNFWSWEDGRHFVHLKTVHFENTKLPETLTDQLMFTHFPNKIRKLQINRGSVGGLGNNALKRFSHVEHLELNKNGITTISRSMFPSHMRRLKYLSFSGNPLVSISADIFTNMPRLEFLFLSNTTLDSLPNETFFPVWDQLEEIYFNGIRLTCNCNSKWMLNVPDFKVFRAPYCDSHQKLLSELHMQEQRDLCRRRGRRV